MADTKKKKKPDPKKKGKGKGAKSEPAAAGAVGVSVAVHPRAVAHVRAAKGWGGLIGFMLAAYLSHGAGLSLAGVGFRALIGGVVGYLVAWALAVNVWRHLVIAELKLHAEKMSGDAGPD
jgi:hypothetical protein